MHLKGMKVHTPDKILLLHEVTSCYAASGKAVYHSSKIAAHVLNTVWSLTECHAQTHTGQKSHTGPGSNLSSCPYFSINFATELKCYAAVTDQEVRNISIEWYRDSCLFSHSDYTAHHDTVVVSSVIPSTNGTYSCLVADENGTCLQSHNFTIDWMLGSLVESSSCGRETTVTKTVCESRDPTSPSSSPTGIHKVWAYTCSSIVNAEY